MGKSLVSCFFETQCTLCLLRRPICVSEKRERGTSGSNFRISLKMLITVHGEYTIADRVNVALNDIGPGIANRRRNWQCDVIAI